MTRILLISILLLYGINNYATDLRSKSNGDWGTLTTWQELSNGNWIDASALPKTNDEVLIRASHIVNISSSTTPKYNLITIEKGGKLTVSADFENSKNFTVLGTFEINGDYSSKSNTSSQVDGQMIVTGSLSATKPITGSGAVKANTYTGNSTIFSISITDINNAGLAGKFVAGSNWIGGSDNNWLTAANWLGVAPTSSNQANLAYAISNTTAANRAIIPNGNTVDGKKLIINAASSMEVQTAAVVEFGTHSGTSTNIEFLIGSEGEVQVEQGGALYIGNTTTGAGLYLDGAEMALSYGGSLTVNDQLSTANNAVGYAANLLIQSDANGSGSVIFESGSPTASVSLYVPKDEWHGISAPVDGITAQDLVNNGVGTEGLWLTWWDESVAQSDDNDISPWTYVQSEDLGMDLTQGKGYSYYWREVLRAAGNPVFVGPLLGSSSLSAQMSYSTNYFNLLGNPYPSSVDLSIEDVSSNVEQSFWIWDGTAGNYLFGSLETGGGSGTGVPLLDPVIATGQAFFMKAIGSSPSFSFTPSMRLHADIGLYKKNTTADSTFQASYVIIHASKDAQRDKAYVVFAEDGSPGFENGADISKLYGSELSPQLLMVSEGEEYSLNYLGELQEDEERVVPLNFICGEEGDQELTFTISNLPDTKVSLEDVQTGTLVEDLYANNTYTFSSLKEDVAERFRLHFVYSPSAIEDPVHTQEELINIYSYNKSVYIRKLRNGYQMKAEVSIFDMYGRQLHNEEINLNELTRIPMNVSNNYLIVKVSSGGKSYVEKIFIK